MAGKRWLITGISSGLGRAIAAEVLQRGGTVVGGAQEGASNLAGNADRLLVLPLELRHPASVQAFLDAAFSAGAVDVLANVAGYGLIGAVEDAADDEVRAMFDVNFFGPVQMIRAALPLLRRQGSGHIVNITSIAGRAPAPGSGAYAASKAALEGLSASLAQELAPLGIHVTAIAPGALRTAFLSTRSIRRSKAPDPAYAETVGRALTVLDGVAGREDGDPARAASAIVAALEAEESPRRLLLGSDALRRMRGELDNAAAEIARWEHVTTGVGFPDNPA